MQPRTVWEHWFLRCPYQHKPARKVVASAGFWHVSFKAQNCSGDGSLLRATGEMEGVIPGKVVPIPGALVVSRICVRKKWI